MAMLGQVILLPLQLDRLASIAAQNGGAIGISQTGSLLHIDTGQVKFDMDAQGNFVMPTNQEPLC